MLTGNQPETQLAAEPVAQFSNVLIATDFSPASEAAFRAALLVCETARAKLTVLNVFEYTATAPPEVGGQLIDWELFLAQARDSLMRLEQRAQQAGLESEAVLCGGLAHMAILDTIRKRKIDLAILGTNAVHGFERLVFGSTAESVLRKAPCPVLTVGPRAANLVAVADSTGPVVFATDFHGCTIGAIRYAASFCRLGAKSLHCLHVLPRSLEGAAQSQVVPQIAIEALQQMVKESGPETGTETESPVCAVTYGSEVSNAIVRYALEHQASLVVLGVREASFAASHIPAHIAFRVIAEAGCPVLTVAFASHHHVSMAACI
jgi:nucleotide-binding universal stress UspA family protein